MKNKPLADLLRPDSIEKIVGQRHLLEENCSFRKIIESKTAVNLAFYGPPGTGKTTFAEIISKNSSKLFKKLNCTVSSTADIKKIISEIDKFSGYDGILLYLDEIQYFNKKQQQILLQYIENGQITLIISTTENPYFCIHGALLSRVTVFEFKSVPENEILKALNRAVIFLQQENKNLEIEQKILKEIAMHSSGDVRKSLNILELAAVSANFGKVTMENVLQISGRSSSKYDKCGDEHYDLLSAFQKSMRGSDVDAAMHYLARLLESGDLISVCRRLMVCACEDVGLAYPQAITFVKSCVEIAFQVGMPEARIPLADAVAMVSLSPKSNSAYLAINEATADVKSGKIGIIPRHLQNKHYDGEDAKVKGQNYLYPHNFPNHFVEQQYLPDAIKNVKYYEFGQNKTEQSFKHFWQKISKK